MASEFRGSGDFLKRPSARKAAEMRAARWRSINTVLTILVGVGMMAVLALWIYPEIRKLDHLQSELESKERVLTEQRLLRQDQERQVQLLRTDPEYIEIIARDKLDLMKEGETIIRLETPAPSKLVAPAASTTP